MGKINDWKDSSLKKMTILSSFTPLKLFQICRFFLLLSTKENILKNVGNQTVAVDFHTMEEKNTFEVNCYHFLVTNISQNILFCVQ